MFIKPDSEAPVHLVLSHCSHESPSCFLRLASIGGESLAVAQNTYAVNWFKGKELNLVFGLQLSMARLVRKRLMKHIYSFEREFIFLLWCEHIE